MTDFIEHVPRNVFGQTRTLVIFYIFDVVLRGVHPQIRMHAILFREKSRRRVLPDMELIKNPVSVSLRKRPQHIRQEESQRAALRYRLVLDIPPRLAHLARC